MDGWLAEGVFTLQKLRLEYELRCRHYSNLYWQRDQGLNPRLKKPKEGESVRDLQRRDHVSWALKPEGRSSRRASRHWCMQEAPTSEQTRLKQPRRMTQESPAICLAHCCPFLCYLDTPSLPVPLGLCTACSLSWKNPQPFPSLAPS